VDRLFELLEIPELREPLVALFNKVGEAERVDLIAKDPRSEFASAAIALYAAAGSFRHAERLRRNVIVPMAPHFASTEVVEVSMPSCMTARSTQRAGSKRS
jgi:hypothetical protein